MSCSDSASLTRRRSSCAGKAFFKRRERVAANSGDSRILRTSSAALSEIVRRRNPRARSMSRAIIENHSSRSCVEIFAKKIPEERLVVAEQRRNTWDLHLEGDELLQWLPFGFLVSGRDIIQLKMCLGDALRHLHS